MKLIAEAASADLESISLLRKSLRKVATELQLAPWLINDLQLVFAELATNAVNHARPRPRSLGLHLDVVGVWLRLRVTDDGGAFHDFDRRIGAIRLRDIAARAESGLGLQLALELFDHLEYQPGSPNTMEAWRGLARRQPTTLLLEDDHSLLEIYSRALRPHARLLTASSSEAAHALLQQQSIDLVVASLETPGGDHWPVVESMAGTPAHARPSLILLTCDANSESARPWAQIDDCRLIEKPASLDQLRQALAGLLRHKLDPQTAGSPSRPRPSGVTYRHGAVETLIASARPPDARGTLAVLDSSHHDRQRLVIAEGLRFGAPGNADCRILADSIRHLTGHDPAPGDATALMAQASDHLFAAHATRLGERPVGAVTVLETWQDGRIELACSSGRPLAILRQGQSRHSSMAVCGPAIGFRATQSYDTVTLKLEPSEQLVLVSESLHTAPPHHPQALPTWIEHAVQADPHATAQELADRLADAVPRAALTAAWDWCVVVVRIASNPASA